MMYYRVDVLALIVCGLILQILAFEVISPEDVDKTNSSAADQILETLIQSNAAVNFAFQPHTKRNKTNHETTKGNNQDINDRINQRIKDLLDKKKVLRKNSTVPNIVWVQVKELNEEEKQPVPANKPVPEFFANAYNRVVNLFSNNKRKSAADSNIISIIEERSATSTVDSLEVTTEGTTAVTDHTETSTSEYPIESFNEIAESLIKFSSSDEKSETESTASDVATTTIQYLPVDTLPAENASNRLQTSLPFKVSVPDNLIFASPPSTLEVSTERPTIMESRTETVTVTTPAPNLWTRFPTRFGTRTTQTRHTPSRWVLNTKAPILLPRQTTVRPIGLSAILHRLSTPKDATFAALGTATQTYIASTPEPLRQNTVSAEALSSIQSFLSQLGVSYKPTQATRLPPWRTTFVNLDEKVTETSTVPIETDKFTTMTSYWKRTTTPKPTPPQKNMIENELFGANPIEVNDNSTSLLKITLLTPGCHAEKSVLMLFNKNQRIQISIDTNEEAPDDEAKKETFSTMRTPVYSKPFVIKEDPMNNTIIAVNSIVKDELQTTTEDVVTTTKSTKQTRRTTKAPQPKPTRVTIARRTRTTKTPNLKKSRRPAVNIEKKTATITTIPTASSNINLSNTTKKTKKKRNKSKKKNATKNKNSSVTVTTAAPTTITTLTKIISSTAAPKKRKISPSKRIIATQRS